MKITPVKGKVHAALSRSAGLNGVSLAVACVSV